MKWGLALTNPAKRSLKRLSPQERHRLNQVFSLMSENPFQGDLKFLKGGNGAIRRRIGNLRVFYELHQDSKVIVVTGVVRRGSNTY